MNTEMAVTVPAEIQAFANVIVEQVKMFMVDSEKKLKLSADVLARIKLAEKQLEERRKFFIKPWNDRVKNTNTLYTTVSDPLEEARMIMNDKIIKYQRQLAEEAAKEQAQLRREETLRQKKLDEEKAALEAKGIKLNIEPQEIAPPIVVAPPRTTAGVYSSMTIKKTPAFRVIDFQKLPDKYKLVNEVALNSSAREGIKNIEGCEFYMKESIQNR